MGYLRVECKNCGKPLRVAESRWKSREATCPKCGKPLRSSPQTQTKTQTQPQIQTKVVVTSGNFKQSGILCLNCKTVTPLGNKKCQGCKSKLKVKPTTVVYYNGAIEAIQCQKCGGYTIVKSVKCQKCNKKLKF